MYKHHVTLFAMVITAIAAAIMPDLRSHLHSIDELRVNEFFWLVYSYVAQGVFAAGFGILFLVRAERAPPMSSHDNILSIEDAARRVR